MNRKAQGKELLKNIMNLGLWVFIILGVVAMGRTLFSPFVRGEDNFINLIEEINTFTADEKSISHKTFLILGKETSISFFSKGSDFISFGANLGRETIMRPGTCSKDKACACLCPEKFLEMETALTKQVCSNPTCVEIKGVDSFVTVDKIVSSSFRLGTIFGKPGTKHDSHFYYLENRYFIGGVIFENGLIRRFDYADANDKSLSDIKNREIMPAVKRPLIIEKIGKDGKTIAICTQTNEENLCYNREKFEAYEAIEAKLDLLKDTFEYIRGYKEEKPIIAEKEPEETGVLRVSMPIEPSRMIVSFGRDKEIISGNCAPIIKMGQHYNIISISYDIDKRPEECNGQSCLCLCDKATFIDKCSNPRCITYGGGEFDFVYNYERDERCGEEIIIPGKEENTTFYVDVIKEDHIKDIIFCDKDVETCEKMKEEYIKDEIALAAYNLFEENIQDCIGKKRNNCFCELEFDDIQKGLISDPSFLYSIRIVDGETKLIRPVGSRESIGAVSEREYKISDFCHLRNPWNIEDLQYGIFEDGYYGSLNLPRGISSRGDNKMRLGIRDGGANPNIDIEPYLLRTVSEDKLNICFVEFNESSRGIIEDNLC